MYHCGSPLFNPKTNKKTAKKLESLVKRGDVGMLCKPNAEEWILHGKPKSSETTQNLSKSVPSLQFSQFVEA